MVRLPTYIVHFYAYKLGIVINTMSSPTYKMGIGINIVHLVIDKVLFKKKSSFAYFMVQANNNKESQKTTKHILTINKLFGIFKKYYYLSTQ